jgi:hypothetical protein
MESVKQLSQAQWNEGHHTIMTRLVQKRKVKTVIELGSYAGYEFTNYRHNIVRTHWRWCRWTWVPLEHTRSKGPRREWKWWGWTSKEAKDIVPKQWYIIGGDCHYVRKSHLRHACKNGDAQHLRRLCNVPKQWYIIGGDCHYVRKSHPRHAHTNDGDA